MLVVPLAVLLTAASPNCASVPLGPPDPAVTDDRIVGTWGDPDVMESDSCNVLRVTRFNEAEYVLDSDWKADDAVLARAYYTRLDSALFLNIQDLEERSWNVYLIRFVTRDRATMYTLMDDEPAATSPEELRRRVIPRLNDPAMYGDSTVLVRATRCKAA